MAAPGMAAAAKPSPRGKRSKVTAPTTTMKATGAAPSTPSKKGSAAAASLGKAEAGKARARSPVLAWAKRVGLDRFNSLQMAYIRLCESQLMPAVTPDVQVLSSLLTRSLRIEVHTMARETVKALSRYLEMDEVQDRLIRMEVVGKAAEKGLAGSGGHGSTLRKTAPLPSHHSGPNGGGGHHVEQASSIFHRLFASIGRLLSRSKALQELTITLMTLTEVDLQNLAQGLERSKKLVSLSLSGCSIGETGLKVMASSLAGSNINLLNLSGNGLPDSTGRWKRLEP